MTNALTLTYDFEETETGGRFIARDGAGHEAELTFSKAGTERIVADHTGVPDAFRGQGVGKALVERLITYVRAEGKKLIPLCPFVRGQLQRNPEWRDVVDQ